MTLAFVYDLIFGYTPHLRYNCVCQAGKNANEIEQYTSRAFEEVKNPNISPKKMTRAEKSESVCLNWFQPFRFFFTLHQTSRWSSALPWFYFHVYSMFSICQFSRVHMMFFFHSFLEHGDGMKIFLFFFFYSVFFHWYSYFCSFDAIFAFYISRFFSCFFSALPYSSI